MKQLCCPYPERFEHAGVSMALALQSQYGTLQINLGIHCRLGAAGRALSVFSPITVVGLTC